MLGVAQTASAKEIKTAFRDLAKRYHPDKNPQDPKAEEKFKGITEAYITLSDPKKKTKYDMVLKYGTTSDVPYSTTRRTQYYRRKYQPYRRREKEVYSRKTYLLVTLAVFGILAIALIFSLAIEKFSSNIEFDEAQQYVKDNEYGQAINSLERSLRPLNMRKYKSYLLLSEIMVYKLDRCDEAMKYIEAGIASTDLDSQKGALSYLQGKCLKQKEQFEAARQSFQNAIDQDASLDSAYYELGELNAYIFKDYQKGLYYFDQLLSINGNYIDAVFGKGYCHQQLGQHKAAIENYSTFITAYPNEGMAYYLKSISETASGDSTQACQDLIQAKALGIVGAQFLLDRHCAWLSIE